MDTGDTVNVLSASNGWFGCAHYRLHLPLGQLAAHGHNIHLPPLDAGRADTHGSASSVYLPDDDRLDWADVIVGQQMANPGLAPHWDRWRAFAPCVYETDDDVFRVDPSNPALPVWVYPGAAEVAQHMISTAALVTTTTDRLADRLAEHAQRVTVLPNCIPAWMLDVQRPRRERLTVGWTGATSHSKDWLAHARPIRRWVLDHPDADLHMIGTDYRRTLEVPARWTDWQPVDRYYRTIDFDIGVAPLADIPFNHTKSPIKLVEYAALGIPAVASAVGPYLDYMRHGETGFLVREPDDWGRYLNMLAADPQMREEMGAKAKQVAAEFTIERRWPEWEAAYRLVL
jgi:glycosyltransferase involved in cell wall biosynthesis